MLNGDEGLSMVETLVSIVIAAVVGSMVTALFVTTMATTRAADGRNEQAAAARSVIDSWSLLASAAVDDKGRSAPDKKRFVAIDQTTAMFCVGLNTKASKQAGDPVSPMGVRIGLEGSQLVEYRWDDCARMQSTDPTYAANVRRVLASRAGLASGAWLVTPLTASDLAATALVDDAALGTTLLMDGSVSATELLSIVGVRIAFQTAPDAARPSPAATYSTIALLGVVR